MQATRPLLLLYVMRKDVEQSDAVHLDHAVYWTKNKEKWDEDLNKRLDNNVGFVR